MRQASACHCPSSAQLINTLTRLKIDAYLDLESVLHKSTITHHYMSVEKLQSCVPKLKYTIRRQNHVFRSQVLAMWTNSTVKLVISVKKSHHSAQPIKFISRILMLV